MLRSHQHDFYSIVREHVTAQRTLEAIMRMTHTIVLYADVCMY
jgi:hypothetical protein